MAIIGRPNVGKSTLFNAWSGRRRAIVSATPGTTRDRLSAVVTADPPEGIEGAAEIPFELIDTGGMGVVDSAPIAEEVARQIETAVFEADVLVFLLDVREGLLPLDREVADVVRRSGKPSVVAANKCETDALEIEAANFASLGLGEAVPVSAESRRNLGELRERVAVLLYEVRPAAEPLDEAPADGADSPPRIAICGRRNAGKSTFVNALAGCERVVVSELPGTTRDTVDVRVEVEGRTLVVVDTAGLGRRREGKSAPDHFSLAVSRRAIERAEAVMLLVDACEPVGTVEREIGKVIRESYRPVVIVVNKWDTVEKAEDEAGGECPGAVGTTAGPARPGAVGTTPASARPGAVGTTPASARPGAVGTTPASARPGAVGTTPASARPGPDEYEAYLARKLVGLAFAPIVFASALEGERVVEAATLAAELALGARRRHRTSVLNRLLASVLAERHPPSPGRRLPRVYYATQTGTSPPTVTVFVNDPARFDAPYVRFLESRFREYWDGEEGGQGEGEVPVRVVLRARPRG